MSNNTNLNNSGNNINNNEAGVYRKASDNMSKGTNSMFDGIKSAVTIEDPDAPQQLQEENEAGVIDHLTNNSNKPKTVVDGAMKGVLSVGRNLFNGVTGIVVQPYRGAKKDGVAGFAKGLVKGVSGAVLLPVVGVCEFVSMTAQGIVNTPLTIIDAMKNAPKDEVQVQVTVVEKPIFFGLSLTESMERAKEKNVPHIISICIAYLSKMTNVEGIFRISGSKTEIDKLQLAFDKGEITSIDSLTNNPSIRIYVHEVACIFKSYFRYQPESIVPPQQINEFMNLQAKTNVDPVEKVAKLKQIVLSIPEPNYSALYHIMELLTKISKNSKETLMTPSNLSIIFGPPLLRPESLADLQQVANCNTVIFHLISFFDQIFTKKPTDHFV
ncbi:RhoGAP domain-containing protein [Cavenderia fasciculata]|uniref:RhoGAP domain-containing protein n=1 Tax=Cavenderia fasciculata TaxID=261658 RepID=F4Q2X3_CACFS|nr:RhoGAP domain-containing protein [Cavenderia fasciculata]EGG17537.1 RhoGAP domain-containing protein [Cavenderia fasciculata]|eukprot:XP_004356021.1 RhoGAP domain-containing protein [Cavenderia fasciculata]